MFSFNKIQPLDLFNWPTVLCPPLVGEVQQSFPQKNFGDCHSGVLQASVQYRYGIFHCPGTLHKWMTRRT